MIDWGKNTRVVPFEEMTAETQRMLNGGSGVTTMSIPTPFSPNEMNSETPQKNQTKSNEDNQANKIIITKQTHKNLLTKYTKLSLLKLK